ncbi:MAG: helix-turn-helix transcriptional regulator [Proteobacteria bacterium]|nr:helix-turn-helix transcriptional regulator [Pseudomonadota bacterium]
MEHLAEIGRRIAAARQAQGWTQTELAARLGVTRSAVAQWETGRAGQVTGTVSRIAEVLGIGVEHLLHGPDPRAPLQALNAEETAMLRLFRSCAPDDRQILLRTARRLSGGK